LKDEKVKNEVNPRDEQSRQRATEQFTTGLPNQGTIGQQGVMNKRDRDAEKEAKQMAKRNRAQIKFEEEKENQLQSKRKKDFYKYDGENKLTDLLAKGSAVSWIVRLGTAENGKPLFDKGIVRSTAEFEAVLKKHPRAQLIVDAVTSKNADFHVKTTFQWFKALRMLGSEQPIPAITFENIQDALESEVIVDVNGSLKKQLSDYKYVPDTFGKGKGAFMLLRNMNKEAHDRYAEYARAQSGNECIHVKSCRMNSETSWKVSCHKVCGGHHCTHFTECDPEKCTKECVDLHKESVHRIQDPCDKYGKTAVDLEVEELDKKFEAVPEYGKVQIQQNPIPAKERKVEFAVVKKTISPEKKAEQERKSWSELVKMNFIKVGPPNEDGSHVKNEAKMVDDKLDTTTMNTHGACWLRHIKSGIQVGTGRLNSNFVHTSRHIFQKEKDDDPEYAINDVEVMFPNIARGFRIASLQKSHRYDYCKIQLVKEDYDKYLELTGGLKEVKVKLMTVGPIWGLFASKNGMQVIPGRCIDINQRADGTYLARHDIDTRSGHSGMCIVDKFGNMIGIHKGTIKDAKVNTCVPMTLKMAEAIRSNQDLSVLAKRDENFRDSLNL